MKKFSERITDIGYFQKSCGYLVQERRKKIVIVFVNQRHMNSCGTCKFLRKIDTSKAPANDYNLFIHNNQLIFPILKLCKVNPVYTSLMSKRWLTYLLLFRAGG